MAGHISPTAARRRPPIGYVAVAALGALLAGGVWLKSANYE